MLGISYSGYLKQDVYNELEKAIIDKEYERACCLSAELGCSRSEVIPIVNFMIDLYCKHFICHNVNFINHLVTKLKLIESCPRRYISRNNTFQTTICELIMLFSFSTPYTSRFDNLLKQIQMYQSSIEKKTSDEYYSEFKTKISDHLLKKLNLLHLFLIDKRKSYAISIVHLCVFDNNSLLCDFTWIDQLSNNDSIKAIIEKNHSDVVWFIWYIIYKVSGKLYNKDLDSYLLSCFELFSINYSKKTRKDRVYILYYLVLFICLRKQVCYSNFTCNMLLLENACKQIHIVYDELLNKNDYENETEESKPLYNKSLEIKEKKTKVQETNKNTKRTLDYLKCYTSYK